MNKPDLLIVDDHSAVMPLLDLALGNRFHLTRVEDAESALRYLLNTTPYAVLIDWALPGEWQGIDLLRHMRRRPEWADLPIAMLTAYDDGPHILEGFKAGADEFFTKPFNPLRLAHWVNETVRLKAQAASIS